MDDERHKWSASQIATFLDCHRKWAWRYIDGHKPKENPYAALGKYVHARLEEYLTDGRLPAGEGVAIAVTKNDGEVFEYTHEDIMALMLPGLKHLPAPGVATVEDEFEMDLGELGILRGYIDFGGFRERGPGVPTSVPVVGDHKTTSGLQWALGPEEMEKNIQCVIYCVYTLEKTGSTTVIARWVYYQTRKPKARKVERTLTAAELVPTWDRIIATIKAMKTTKESGVSAKEVNYDTTACGKYGGCPFEKLCGLSPMEKFRSQRDMINLKAKMAARQAAAAEPEIPQPEPQVPVEGAGTAINPPEGKSALAALKARAAKNTAPAAEAPPTQRPQANPPPPPAPTKAGDIHITITAEAIRLLLGQK